MDLFGSRYVLQLTLQTTDIVKYICTECAHRLPHPEPTWAPKCQDAHKVNILTLINKASAFEIHKIFTMPDVHTQVSLAVFDVLEHYETSMTDFQNVISTNYVFCIQCFQYKIYSLCFHSKTKCYYFTLENRCMSISYSVGP